MDLHSRRSFSGKRSFTFRTLIIDDKQRLYRKKEKYVYIYRSLCRISRIRSLAQLGSLTHKNHNRSKTKGEKTMFTGFCIIGGIVVFETFLYILGS